MSELIGERGVYLVLSHNLSFITLVTRKSFITVHGGRNHVNSTRFFPRVD